MAESKHVTYEDAGVDTAEGGRAVDAIKQMVKETNRPEVIGGIGKEPHMAESKHVTYEDAGVDTAEGGRAVDAIKQMVKETNRPEVIGGIGGFGHMAESKHVTYEDAGVDTAEGGRAVDAIKQMVKETNRPEVIGGIGGFGGLFSAAALKDMEDPILISGTDGVGTKLVLAQILDRHETVGQDLVAMCLVAMCVNDILASGAEPLFFLDYVAIGHIEAEHMAKIVKGVADGCKLAGCALVGGEMAEHPGVMRPDDYDLAGFTVGVVDRPKMIDPANVAEGGRAVDAIKQRVKETDLPKVIGGIGGAGGMSSAAANKDEQDPIEVAPGLTLADALLAPTRIYVKPILELLRGEAGKHVHAIAHITGGGITENLNRALPANVDALVHRDGAKMGWDVPPVITYISENAELTPNEGGITENLNRALPANVDALVHRDGAKMGWDVPPVITYISENAELTPNEACKTFNMGVGLMLIVSAEDEAAVTEALVAMGEKPFRVGTCIAGSGEVKCKTFNMGVGLMLIVSAEDEAAVTEALVAMGEKPFRVGTCIAGSGEVKYTDEQ